MILSYWCLGNVQLEHHPVHYWFIKKISVQCRQYGGLAKYFVLQQPFNVRNCSSQFSHGTSYFLLCPIVSKYSNVFNKLFNSSKIHYMYWKILALSEVQPPLSRMVIWMNDWQLVKTILMSKFWGVITLNPWQCGNAFQLHPFLFSTLSGIKRQGQQWFYRLGNFKI